MPSDSQPSALAPQLPLFGYDVIPTGVGGQWTVRAKKPDATLLRPTMRVARAAQIARCSVQTIYIAIIAGEIEADPISPTHKRVFADSLYSWISARQGEDYWTPARRAQWQAASNSFHGGHEKKSRSAKSRLAKKPAKH